jgi:hypothetical protein
MQVKLFNLTMTFRTQVIAGLEQFGGPGAAIESTRSIGAVHIGGGVDRAVAMDATNVYLPQKASADVAGIMHSIETPADPLQPLQMHFIEGEYGHARLAEAVGEAHPYSSFVSLPAMGETETPFTVLYYANFGRAGVQFAFAEQGEVRTRQVITSGVVQVLGSYMLTYAPDARAINCHVSVGERPTQNFSVPSQDITAYKVPSEYVGG